MFVYCRILCIQESLSREFWGIYLNYMRFGNDNDAPHIFQLTKSTSCESLRPILTVILSVLLATGLQVTSVSNRCKRRDKDAPYEPVVIAK